MVHTVFGDRTAANNSPGKTKKWAVKYFSSEIDKTSYENS